MTFTVFYSYQPLDTITNLNLNGNILNIVTAGNAIDRLNLQGGSGIDASSMNPTSGPAATFGGTQTYSFPSGLTVNGSLTAAPVISGPAVSAPVGPGYTNTGVALGPTFHIASGTTSGALAFTVTLTNNAVFTSISSYAVFATGNTGSCFVQNLSGTQFRVNPGGSGTHVWTAIGT